MPQPMSPRSPCLLKTASVGGNQARGRKGWADKVFDCAWMHITGDIPKGTPKDRLVYLIDISGEGLVYDKNGTPKQGITCYASQFDYRLGLPVKKVVLDDNLSEGGRAEVFIDCGANDLIGNLKNNLEVVQMDIALVNPEIQRLGLRHRGTAVGV